MLERFLFSLVIFLLCGYLLVQAQTPSSAIDHYEHGVKRLQNGDLDRAIEDFTKAISISSHLDSSQLIRGNAPPGRKGFTASAGEAREITVVNPLTPNAYTIPRPARYPKGVADA